MHFQRSSNLVSLGIVHFGQDALGKLDFRKPDTSTGRIALHEKQRWNAFMCKPLLTVSKLLQRLHATL
jgi:hypothetical protein